MKSFMLSIILLTILLCSCRVEETTYGPYVYEFNEKAFNEHQAEWQKIKPNNYQFTQKFWYSTQKPNDPVKITVENGIKISEENLLFYEDWIHEDLKYCWILEDTIDGIYSRIKRDIAADKKRFDNKELIILTVKIEYDKTWHYPKVIDYDCVNSESYGEGGGGGTYHLNLTDFKRLGE